MYHDAKQALGTSTKHNLIAVDTANAVHVDGDFIVGEGRSMFYHGFFSSGKPCILKFPEAEEAARHECNVYRSISPIDDGYKHLVTVSLAEFNEIPGRTNLRFALVMDVYIRTLDHCDATSFSQWGFSISW